MNCECWAYGTGICTVFKAKQPRCSYGEIGTKQQEWGTACSSGCLAFPRGLAGAVAAAAAWVERYSSLVSAFYKAKRCGTSMQAFTNTETAGRVASKR